MELNYNQNTLLNPDDLVLGANKVAALIVDTMKPGIIRSTLENPSLKVEENVTRAYQTGTEFLKKVVEQVSKDLGDFVGRTHDQYSYRKDLNTGVDYEQVERNLKSLQENKDLMASLPVVVAGAELVASKVGQQTVDTIAKSLGIKQGEMKLFKMQAEAAIDNTVPPVGQLVQKEKSQEQSR